MRVVVIVVIITSIPVAVIFFSPFSTPQALAFVKPLSLCEWGRERESRSLAAQRLMHLGSDAVGLSILPWLATIAQRKAA